MQCPGGAYDTVPEVNLLLALFNTSDKYVPVLFDEAGKSSVTRNLNCALTDRRSVSYHSSRRSPCCDPIPCLRARGSSPLGAPPSLPRGQLEAPGTPGAWPHAWCEVLVRTSWSRLAVRERCRPSQSRQDRVPPWIRRLPAGTHGSMSFSHAPSHT